MEVQVFIKQGKVWSWVPVPIDTASGVRLVLKDGQTLDISENNNYPGAFYVASDINLELSPHASNVVTIKTER